MINITSLTELNEKARDEGKIYTKKRFAYENIKKNLKRPFLAIIGPRGVGKSVLLRQILCEEERSFYVSLDVESIDITLFELAKELCKRGIKILLIDEIHGYPYFAKELKKIYDFLPDLNIIFTSSCSLSLYRSSVDLSRRVKTILLPPFSFREYLYFKKNELLNPINFSDILDEKKSREYYGSMLKYEAQFEEFLQGKNYPFALNQNDFLLFKSILETIIENDLIKKEGVSLDESFEIRRMLAFIGRSDVEGISYSSISKNCGFSKFKAEKYVSLLEKSFILRKVMPKGTNVSREPKILFSPPYRLIYKGYDDAIGALREDFFVDTIMNLGFSINYLKSKRGEKTPDYVVNDIVFEIGGVSKRFSQLKGYKEKKKIILTHPGVIDSNKRPLFFIGMLNSVC